MQFKNIKAVIFDLDDTLYPQKEYTRQCLLATVPYISRVSGCNPELISAKLNSILDENGIEYKKTYNDLFEAINFEGVSHIKDIIKLFRACKPKVEAYPNVHKTLESLQSSYRLGMITDGYEIVQNYKIAQLNLSNYFERILVTDTLGIENRKPSNIPYEKMLELMGLEPELCVYVGNDPWKDFVACKSLGMRSVRINQGDYKDLILEQEYEADFCVNDIIDLLGIIK